MSTAYAPVPTIAAGNIDNGSSLPSILFGEDDVTDGSGIVLEIVEGGNTTGVVAFDGPEIPDTVAQIYASNPPAENVGSKTVALDERYDTIQRLTASSPIMQLLVTHPKWMEMFRQYEEVLEDHNADERQRNAAFERYLEFVERRAKVILEIGEVLDSRGLNVILE